MADQAERSAGAPAPDAPDERSETIAALTRSVLYERELSGAAAQVTGSMRELLGYDPAEVRAGGHAWWLAKVHDDDRHIVASRFDPDALGDAAPWSVEYRVRRADGEWALVRDRGRLFPARDGKPARILGVLSDVSGTRALRDDLLRAQRLEIVARLAAGVAHDFNNVLSAIGGFTSVLLEDCGDDPTLADDLRQIETLVARGAALSQNLLGLAKPGGTGTRRLISLGDEIRRLAPTIRILMGTGIECTFELPPVEQTAYLEPTALDQVLLNLAANARDAMPNGGRLHILADADLRRIPPRLRLEIRDSGQGMPPQVLASCFTPFFTTKGERRGTGLGLWLVREIVEGAGGRIALRSEPQRGTTVSIEFPAVDEVPSADPVPLPRSAPTASGLTLLFIEDEDIVRNVTRRLLERSGFAVLDVADGAAGLAMLERRRHELDAVITDLHMPGLAGPSLVRRLREVAPEIGVLVMSGLAERISDLAPIPGILEIAPKPCDPADLVRTAVGLAKATRLRRQAQLIRGDARSA